MLLKIHKRIIVYFIALIVSIIIWNINASWGNNFYTCLILSTTTFLIIITPFEIYFAFRDIWFERWITLISKQITMEEKEIKVSDGYLKAELIKPVIKKRMEEVNTIIVIAHGFSDTKEKLQYFYFPLVYQGYIVLAYDARGIGKSKKTGKRSQFIERIDDFKKILNWISNDACMKNMDIFCIGFSIGALTILCGGFEDERIKKIIAISSMSNYKKSIQDSGFVVRFSYSMKGVELFPNEEINEKLSPYLIIESIKKQIPEDKWKKLSRRIMLIHSQNDKIIPIINFNKNKKILELPENNQVIFRKGGHAQKKNELALIGETLRFFNQFPL